MKRIRVQRPGTLRVETEQTSPGAHVVVVAGELDMSTAAGLVETLGRIVQSKPMSVVLDLSGCDFLDSSGVGALLEADRALQRSGSRLELVASPFVSRTLQAVGLDQHFPLRVPRPPARRDEDDERGVAAPVGSPP